MPRLILLLLLAGCAETTDVYQIDVALESNTCGASVQPLADGLSYRIQFKVDPPKVTWKVLPKGMQITGSYNEDDDGFRIHVSQTLSLDNIDAGIVGCSVIREETIEGTFVADAGASDGGYAYPLEAEHTVGFSADSKGTCRGATGPLGPFDRLPCAAKYALTGEAKDDN
jgi:hypothetical protein